MKIILSGGGTLGPVIPLLAIAEAYKKNFPDAEFVWVGTKNGPEKPVVIQAGLPFFVIGAGKWRRYFSLLNLADILRIVVGFFQSLLFLWQEKPDALISCGGFVSVPLHFAGWLLGIPAWVHQQDVRVGLANKLMFPFAQKITTALSDTATRLPRKKTEWIGNPSRNLTVAPETSRNVIRAQFNIPPNVPVIFALGGGTGSSSINKIILEALPQWPKDWHVIHLLGRERPRELSERAAQTFSNYHVFDFFTYEMKLAYAIADVVVARAGFSTLTEVAQLSKPSVILPMFGTHQEDNARVFANHGGIVMLAQGEDSGLKLAKIVNDLITHPEERLSLGDRIHTLLPRAKDEKIVEIINFLIKK